MRRIYDDQKTSLDFYLHSNSHITESSISGTIFHLIVESSRNGDSSAVSVLRNVRRKCRILTCLDRELFFSSHWLTTIENFKTSLDPDDLETVECFRSWNDVQENLLDGVPSSVALIRPALSHLSTFADFFVTKLGPDLDASFLWGTLACLLQASRPEDDHRDSRISPTKWTDQLCSLSPKIPKP